MSEEEKFEGTPITEFVEGFPGDVTKDVTKEEEEDPKDNVKAMLEQIEEIRGEVRSLKENLIAIKRTAGFMELLLFIITVLALLKAY